MEREVACGLEEMHCQGACRLEEDDMQGNTCGLDCSKHALSLPASARPFASSSRLCARLTHHHHPVSYTHLTLPTICSV
eukprot:720631-Rhodomonas_salina.2